MIKDHKVKGSSRCATDESWKVRLRLHVIWDQLKFDPSLYGAIRFCRECLRLLLYGISSILFHFLLLL